MAAMINGSAHRSMWRTSDAIFGVVLLVGTVLHFVIPLPSLTAGTPGIRVASGMLFLIFGLSLIVSGKRGLRQAGQPSAPNNPTTQIVESGIYRYSRNPMYLGLLVLEVGIGMLMESVWLIVVVLPMFFAMKYILVIPEERYLLRQFGDEYQSYMSRVRRWL